MVQMANVLGTHVRSSQLMTLCCPLQSQEALRRAKFKFAGRQKIVVSRNW